MIGVTKNRFPGGKKMTRQEFHRTHGHIGFDPSCEVCLAVRRSLRSIIATTDPYRDQRPGHTWSMDTITRRRDRENGANTLAQAGSAQPQLYDLNRISTWSKTAIIPIGTTTLGR